MSLTDLPLSRRNSLFGVLVSTLPQLLCPFIPSITPMQRQAVESTNIKSIGYDPEDEVLEVEFHSGGGYHYVGVPAAGYEGMLAARSKGRYFGDFIRLRYPYEKIR